MYVLYIDPTEKFHEQRFSGSIKFHIAVALSQAKTHTHHIANMHKYHKMRNIVSYTSMWGLPPQAICFNYGALGVNEFTGRGTGFVHKSKYGFPSNLTPHGIVDEQRKKSACVFSKTQHPVIKTLHSTIRLKGRKTSYIFGSQRCMISYVKMNIRCSY